MKEAPKNTVFATILRFPFRSKEDDIKTLQGKYYRVADKLNQLKGVGDTYYEEDERWGLYVEVEIPVNSEIVNKPLSEIHKGIYEVLKEYYNIDQCY